MENDHILQRLEEKKFDIAIVDSMMNAKCGYLIPHRLHIPWITQSFGVDPFAIRAPWLPSFVPSIIFPLSDRMNLYERFVNTVFTLVVHCATTFYFPESELEILLRYRRYGDFGSLDELASRSVLWLLDAGDVLDYPRPMMPNMVSISGLASERSADKLPPDVEHFIDGAREGVILMTFGSTASRLPAHLVAKFAAAFGQLGGYRVIWRLNNEHDVELPANVMTGNWLPQNDILAHPSVKLFITHAGHFGVYEALYHGVPMLAFPVFGDQHHNARRLDERSYGVSMDLQKFTTSSFLANVRLILDDRSYKDRVLKASEIFRSQAQSQTERATFWIEHVCQFGGEHLRSAGNDLPLYSYLMLDVLAILVVVLHIGFFLLYKLLALIAFVVRKQNGHPSSRTALKKNN